MGLGFGLLSAQRRGDEDGWERAYAHTLRLAVEAERLGFDSVWTTEHHFVDDGYMPSLAVVSAAIAARTSDVEIGTGVVLAPLYDPLRLAEDAATVGLLSQGRFTLGLGLGWSEIEYEALGPSMSVRGRAMEEILQILPRAWSGEPFRHRGEVYDYPRLAVRPTPAHRIPVLIGGGAEAAIRRAARLADGIYSNARRDDFIQQLRWIDDECERVGRDPGELRIVHYSVMLPAAGEEEAMNRYAGHLWHMMWKYSDMEDSAIRPDPPPDPPEFDESRRASLFGRSTIAGSPQRIVDSLSSLREEAGRPVEFVARSYFHTLELDQQIDLMTQLAEEVAPHV